MASSSEYCRAQAKIKQVDDAIWETLKRTWIIDEDLEENSNS